MSVSISAGSVSASSVPSSGEMDSFSQGLKSQSTDQLLSKLGSSSTPDWQKDAISKELQNRAESNQSASGTDGSSSADGSSDDGSDTEQLLKKLMNGTISSEELQKLAKMLGVDPSTLEAMAGQGSSSSSGSSTGEISGG